MFKKVLKISKFILIGAVWTYIYLYASLFLMTSAWNFNYLSASDWNIISAYWEQGGSIKQFKDYCFFITLLLIIPVWIMGWKYLYHRNFVAILLAPILWYNNKKLAKYGQAASRIVLKNMGTTGKKIDPYEFIVNKLKTIKDDMEKKEKTSEVLRESLKERFEDKKLK